MAEVERSLERYDVLERIAVGGMAEVFLAKAYGAHGFEKTLAIKRILPELARDPEFEERFIAEAKVAVKLSHTNIVQVFDFGRFAGSLFIAMEFIDGLDLAALLRRGKEHDRLMPIPAAFQTAIEIARGLDFAHSHGVVHRDVSPSNILLSRAGEVKIADFGIAVAARPGPAAAAVARKVMGKWRYMSPEQARGDQVGTKSDLFSAASVMFELFTGEKLFPGEEADEIIRNIHEMPIPKASQMRAGLPARLDEILASALMRRPDDRPARAALLQRQLTELSYESSIVATAMDVSEAVAAVIDLRAPVGRNSLDDQIRRQIAGALGGIPVGDRSTAVHEVSRHTAQATFDPDASDLMQKIDETGRATLLSEVDEHGITRLVDETTIGAVPKALSRNTGSLPAVVEPSGPMSSLPAMSSGPVKQLRSSSGLTPLPPGDAADRAVRFERMDVAVSEAPGTSRRVLIIAGVLLVAGGVGAGVWVSRRAAEPQAIAPPAPIVTDAPIALARMGTLVVDSVPSGATASIDGHVIGTTPVSYDAAAGRPLAVAVTLAGYQPVTDYKVTLAAGERIVYRPSLAPARASLHVESDPPGATVTLHGRVIGETPLDLADLDPTGKAELAISLGGYERATAPVDLRAGDPAVARVVLKALPKIGTIKIQVVGDIGWGDVYLGGKKIGRAPSPTIRLPVGHQHLRLVNPPSGRETFLDVDVSDTEARLFTAHF